MNTEYERRKKDFLAGRITGCKTYFLKNSYYVEAAYCDIMLDKLEEAQELFLKEKDKNSRANWGLFLLQLLKGNIKSYPTYFEIRNFLELDLNMLILYCKGDYVERIIRYADYMAYYNPESYKFIGRVFWANNLIPAAMFYLRRAKDKFYQDPELHYLLGYIYFTINKDMEKCRKALDTCLELLPEYAPALALYKKLPQ